MGGGRLLFVLDVVLRAAEAATGRVTVGFGGGAVQADDFRELGQPTALVYESSRSKTVSGAVAELCGRESRVILNPGAFNEVMKLPLKTLTGTILYLSPSCCTISPTSTFSSKLLSPPRLLTSRTTLSLGMRTRNPRSLSAV